MCSERFVIFPYFSLSICGACKAASSFTPTVDHLYLLSVFLSVALEVYYFMDVSEENTFGFTDFSLFFCF